MDEQAVIDQITENASEHVVTTLEIEANEIRGFESGKFVDSEEFDDLKARVDSGLYTIIMKEMTRHNKKKQV